MILTIQIGSLVTSGRKVRFEPLLPFSLQFSEAGAELAVLLQTV